MRPYVPVLWTKRGERSALRDLQPQVKAGLTPLFVVPPITFDFQNAMPSRTIDRHLDTLAVDLARAWGTAPAVIDLLHVDDDELMQDGSHPLMWLTNEAAFVGLPLIPAVSPSRSHEYLAAVAGVQARYGRGICLRLPVSEWPTAGGFSPIESLMTELNVSVPEVDLVLDLGSGPGRSPSHALQVLRAELTGLPHATRWRSLVVAGTAFPSPLTVAKGHSLIERTEWLVYSAVVSGGHVPRIPVFGDYAIASPDPGGDIDPSKISLSAQLRYTVSDAWLIAKGNLFKGRGGTGHGGRAMTPVAANLIESPHFAGEKHCAGDRWIQDAASGEGSGGNAEAWRRVGTVHHLTQVTDELASLSALSGPP